MGMVLSAMPIGEYDKRLVILTRERGKIAVFARGARKPNCALLACSQPFSFGEFVVYQGKNAYNLVSANISNYFGELREDLNSVYYGCYFCEFADYLTRENVNSSDILKLLYQSLKVLSKKTIPVELIRYIFELKIMVLNGEAPQMFECVKCGQEKQNLLFHAESGGLICEECLDGKQKNDMVMLSGSTIYTMQFIITSPIEKLYTFKVSEIVLEELKNCMKYYLKVYVNYKFKSLELISFNF